MKAIVAIVLLVLGCGSSAPPTPDATKEPGVDAGGAGGELNEASAVDAVADREAAQEVAVTTDAGEDVDAVEAEPDGPRAVEVGTEVASDALPLFWTLVFNNTCSGTMTLGATRGGGGLPVEGDFACKQLTTWAAWGNIAGLMSGDALTITFMPTAGDKNPPGNYAATGTWDGTQIAGMLTAGGKAIAWSATPTH